MAEIEETDVGAAIRMAGQRMADQLDNVAISLRHADGVKEGLQSIAGAIESHANAIDCLAEAVASLRTPRVSGP
jgi:hypothetical protein